MNLYLAGLGGIMNGVICRSCNGGKCLDLLNDNERREDLSKFIAQEYSLTKRCGGRELFKDTNILQSYYYANDFTTNIIIPQCENFMLDSGVFTMAYGTQAKVNYDEYTEKYIQFINDNKIKLFFEMDVDDIAGLEKAEELRKKLERGTGRQPIPIFHKSRGKEYFVDMCKNYPYVAIGGIAGKGNQRKEYEPYFKWFIETAHRHGAKIHALGYTDLKGLEKFKFDSCDSTSWINGNRFGSIYRFNGRTMEKYDKKQGQRLADARQVALHNFKEWVKFQQYARTNL